MHLPFANYEAEWNLRTTKLPENFSGRFRTLQEAEDFATLRSVANIARDTRSNAIESLAGSDEFFVKALPLKRAELRKLTDQRPNQQGQSWN